MSFIRGDDATGLTPTTIKLEWPILHPDALHGLPGDFVRALDPHTEADLAALLFQTLTAFGSVIGRGPYYQVEADRHYPNLFTCLVGQTAKGRKGTSWGYIRKLFAGLDTTWTTTGNLGSGEGLIHAVRDPREVEDEKTGEIKTVDGVQDKRLLVFEGEFAHPLRVMRRETCTLSPTIRQAWDNGDLRITTRTNPETATGAHVSIIGHITADELRRDLAALEGTNGFANRFLWVLVRRSKTLPDGGNMNADTFDNFIAFFMERVNHARSVGRVTMNPDARALWHAVYPGLSGGHLGRWGSVTARAEAQVIRLALVYALLDCKDVIGVEHLRAALAAWQYCDQSASYVFGDSTGNTMADRILGMVRDRPDGVTRTAIRDLFDRNKPSDTIDEALRLLADANLIRVEKADTGGRPAETWYPVKESDNHTTKTTKGTALVVSVVLPEREEPADYAALADWSSPDEAYERKERAAIENEGGR